jgi:hypothetical protein
MDMGLYQVRFGWVTGGSCFVVAESRGEALKEAEATVDGEAPETAGAGRVQIERLGTVRGERIEPGVVVAVPREALAADPAPTDVPVGAPY